MLYIDVEKRCVAYILFVHKWEKCLGESAMFGKIMIRNVFMNCTMLFVWGKRAGHWQCLNPCYNTTKRTQLFPPFSQLVQKMLLFPTCCTPDGKAKWQMLL